MIRSAVAVQRESEIYMSCRGQGRLRGRSCTWGKALQFGLRLNDSTFLLAHSPVAVGQVHPVQDSSLVT